MEGGIIVGDNTEHTEALLAVKTFGQVKIVSLVPRLDANSAPPVEKELQELIAGSAPQLVCDFSRTEYISSAGLRVLLSVLKKVQKSGGRLALSALKPGVREIFDMAGFTNLYSIYETEGDAFRSMET